VCLIGAVELQLYFYSKLTRMSEAIYDPVAYSHLTDSVLQQIMLSSDPNLRKVCRSVV
jgi:hypothetical protein